MRTGRRTTCSVTAWTRTTARSTSTSRTSGSRILATSTSTTAPWEGPDPRRPRGPVAAGPPRPRSQHEQANLHRDDCGTYDRTRDPARRPARERAGRRAAAALGAFRPCRAGADGLLDPQHGERDRPPE